MILYRALRSDVEPRVVAIDENEHEVVREEGAPEGDGVYLIDRFEVPAGEAEAFLADWDGTRAALAGRRGYLGARLYRARAHFVEIARWSSPLMVHRARDMLPPDSALYQVAG